MVKVRSVVVGILCALAILVSVQPAAAQEKKTEFALGYQFLRFLEDGGENIPAGWGASVASAINDMFKVVGDVGGHYKDGAKLHTFQGGVEFAGKNPKVTPFGRVLAGIGVSSEDGESETGFVITPEAGVKIMGSGRIGGQFAVGFPIMRDNGFTDTTLRLFVGVTIR
jgi:hypothetical protein